VFTVIISPGITTIYYCEVISHGFTTNGDL